MKASWITVRGGLPSEASVWRCRSDKRRSNVKCKNWIRVRRSMINRSRYVCLITVSLLACDSTRVRGACADLPLLFLSSVTGKWRRKSNFAISPGYVGITVIAFPVCTYAVCLLPVNREPAVGTTGTVHAKWSDFHERLVQPGGERI